VADGLPSGAPVTLLRSATAAVLLFLHAPIVVIILSSFSPESYLTLPTGAISWRWYREIPNHPEFLRALWLSIQLGVATVAVSTTCGIPAALALTRYQFLGRQLLAGACLSPLTVPVVVTALALLQFLNPLGLDGTFIGLLAAHTVLTLPYSIRTASASLAGLPRAVEFAAQDLGAGPLQTFFLVTLPLARQGIIAGAVMVFLVSFDTFTVTFFLAGPQFRTLPLEIYNYSVFYIDPLISAISSLLIGASIATVILVQRFFGLREVLVGKD
jgi:putative spermidine/putrescine transport system permease protein